MLYLVASSMHTEQVCFVVIKKSIIERTIDAKVYAYVFDVICVIALTISLTVCGETHAEGHAYELDVTCIIGIIWFRKQQMLTNHAV